MIELRDYQQEAVSKIIETLIGLNALVVSPTGSGKTEIGVAISKYYLEQNKNVLFCCHLSNLVYQAGERFKRYGIPVGYIKAGIEEQRDCQIQIASVQTLSNRDWFKPDIVIVDEAHLVANYKVLKKFLKSESVSVLGLTATPFPRTGFNLAKYFTENIVVATYAELIQKQYLVQPHYYVCGVEARMRTKMGEFDIDDMRDSYHNHIQMRRTVEHYQKIMPNEKAICFSIDVAHAYDLANFFKEAGVPAEAISGEMSEKERELIIERFKTGETQVLVNCQICREGFDLPDCVGVILARPTKQLHTWTQMIGRGLRPSPDKEKAIILDMANSLARHGFVEDIPKKEYELQPNVDFKQKERERKKLEKKYIVCANCGLSNPFKSITCKACGQIHSYYPFVHAERQHLFKNDWKAKKLENSAERIFSKGHKVGKIYFDWKYLTNEDFMPSKYRYGLFIKALEITNDEQMLDVLRWMARTANNINQFRRNTKIEFGEYLNVFNPLILSVETEVFSGNNKLTN